MLVGGARRGVPVGPGPAAGVGELEPGDLAGGSSSARSSANVVDGGRRRARAGAGWPGRRRARRWPRPRQSAAARAEARHRRRTRSVGRPSVVPSQPSIGRIAKRLGAVIGPALASVKLTGVGERAGRDRRVGDRDLDARARRDGRGSVSIVSRRLTWGYRSSCSSPQCVRAIVGEHRAVARRGAGVHRAGSRRSSTSRAARTTSRRRGGSRAPDRGT